MIDSIDLIFGLIEKIGTFLLTPPCSIFLALIFCCFAVKIIKIITKF